MPDGNTRRDRFATEARDDAPPHRRRCEPPLYEWQEFLNHNKGAWQSAFNPLSIPINCRSPRHINNRTGGSQSRTLIFPDPVGKRLDLFRKFTQNDGKRNGTSYVPYETIAFSERDKYCSLRSQHHDRVPYNTTNHVPNDTIALNTVRAGPN